MTDRAHTAARVGPILLAPGIRPRDVMFYLIVTAVLQCLIAFLGIIQPYVFNEQLHIPVGEQGRLTGNLSAVQQSAMLIFVVLFGALSDRFGRRLFLILATLGMTTSILLYPVATAVWPLFLLRFLFGASFACNSAGGPAMRMDLTDNQSRGRFLSLLLVVNAIASTVLVSWLGTRLPAWLVDRGVGGADAGRYTFWVVGIVGLLGLLAAFKGLRRDRPTVDLLSIGQQLKKSVQSLRDVLAYAKSNRRYRIVLIASVVLRADDAVIKTFISLWVINQGRAEGMTTSDAFKAFGLIAVVMGATDLLGGVAAGFVADRVNRMRMLMWSVVGTAAALGSTLFINQITGPAILACVVAIHLAEVFQVASSQALIGEETPAHLRGSGYGVISWIGTLSVIAVSFVAGYLVDGVGYKAPFLLMAALGIGFLALALLMLRQAPIATETQAVVSE